MLVAAAIILIPELLSGPHHAEIAQHPRQDETALRSFNIDLSRRGAGERSVAQLPPPAAVKPSDDDLPPQEMPGSETVTAPAAPEDAVTAGGPQVAQAPLPENELKEVPPRDEPSAAAPAEIAESVSKRPLGAKVPGPAASRKQPAAATVASATGRGWAVQVGSFGDDTVAHRIAQKLKEKGYAAFVMPFKTGTKTLYRVRIGPQGQRAAAEAIAVRLKAEGTAGSVVAHP